MDPCLTLFPYIVFLTIPFLTPCGAQSCLSSLTPDMTIAITGEVLQTVRSTDPLYTADAEECAAACCAEHKIAGHKDCNLYIFDTRKIQKHLNCYLFHCPTPESCPLKRSKGVMSFRILAENEDVVMNRPSIQGPVSSDQGKEVEKFASKGTANGSHSQGDKSRISDPKENAQSLETEKSTLSAHSQGDTKDRVDHPEHPKSSEDKHLGSDVQSQGDTSQFTDPVEHSHRSDSEDSVVQTLGDTSQFPDPIEQFHSYESKDSDVQSQHDKSKTSDPIENTKISEDRQSGSGAKSHGQKQQIYPAEDSQSSEDGTFVQSQVDRSQPSNPVEDSQSSNSKESEAKSQDDTKQISDPTEDSRSSQNRKIASNVQSQVDRSQPSDPIEDTQSSESKKSVAKSQDDTKQISDPTEDSQSSEANDPGYEGKTRQTPNLKSSSDMVSESEIKESDLKGLSKGSATKIQVGSTDKDPEKVQNHITSQMIDLAKDIEKQLGLMESKEDPSTDRTSLSSSSTNSHHNASGSDHDVGIQNAPSFGVDKKSGQADSKVMFHNPTKFFEEHPTTPPSNLKSASLHLLITKAPQDDSHYMEPAIDQMPIEKDIKNALSSSRHGSRLSEEHTTTKVLKTLHLTSSTKIPGTTPLHKPRTPVLATHSAPSKVLPERKSKATTLFPEPEVHMSKTLMHPARVTLKSSDHANPESSLKEDHPILTQHNSQSDKANNLDTHGAFDNFFLEERNGLVAALVFGVVFLLVVIGLVGRKVFEVRRRYQYNKLDYLINGMYVDT
ncbi:nipped-B-like protein [Xenopus laevis]|uniref:Nipped-B-like protein n=2 Tax=Xenopus laevis TaxID=8355 RepID=A0A1L8GQP1_XENLA|nr:nipped-B-like protein [Xenopus laevis]XP_041443841.1 nipped-B-like protein [Xenopus laevis]OCT86150.1 hypothetical protein XELAEV_18019844mg [Xenopus laevis]